jgi:hypothetical protein
MSAEPTTGPTDDLHTFLSVIWRSGDVREVRLPKWDGHQVASGYFDDPVQLATAVGTWDGTACIYLTLNPVNPALLYRAENRIRPSVGRGETTSDADIAARRWLLVDVDPVRATDTSATDAESMAAQVRSREVYSYLRERGWPEPVAEMTGNGWGLLYAIDLPNDKASTTLVVGVIAHLAERFTDDAVTIDTSVTNAARIGCLVGTRKVKGEPTPERPHRRSALKSVPASIDVVPVELLRELAGAQFDAHADPGAAADDGDPGSSWGVDPGWVREWLDRAGVGFHEAVRGDNTWYRLDVCPFHPEISDAWTVASELPVDAESHGVPANVSHPGGPDGPGGLQEFGRARFYFAGQGDDHSLGTTWLCASPDGSRWREIPTPTGMGAFRRIVGWAGRVVLVAWTDGGNDSEFWLGRVTGTK